MDSGPLVEGEHSHPARAVAAQVIDNQLSSLGVLDDVGGHFGYYNGHIAALRFPHADKLRAPHRRTACGPGMRGVANLNKDLRCGCIAYFHRTMVTLVPSPTRETTSNSFTSLLAPPRPSPNPEPVVKPSRRAS